MMKFLTIILVFLCSFPIYVKSQDSIPSLKESIVGRWMESKRIEGESVKDIGEHPDTYVFRDNMIFHKGESAEGVILFNITGQYTVEDNSIVVLYKDYLKKNATAEKSKKLVFNILSMNEDRNEMLVSVQDYDYEYQMLLRK